MNRRTNDCFDHNAVFGPMSVESGGDHACLKDYLLNPSTLDKNCDSLFYNNNGSYTQSMQHYNNCNDTLSGALHHNNIATPDFSAMHNFESNYSIPNYTLPMTNQTIMNHTDYNNIPNNDYSLLNAIPSLSSIYSHAPSTNLLNQTLGSDSNILLNQPIHNRNSVNASCLNPESLLARSICDTNSIMNSSITCEPNTMSQSVIHESSSLPLVPAASGVPEFSSSYNDIVPNGNSYISSPIFGAESGIPQSKVDCDPFSPSISSNVSSVPSIELSDKTSYIPGSVDSGVVVNGSISSPFSVSESNRNGECCSVSDSFISPSTQRTGSERSIETTPGSESVSSELCSPKVDIEELSIEPTSENPVIIKEKSHKGRKRKGDSRKEKSKHKKQIIIIKPTYQSEISPEENGIKLKISITTPPPIPIKKRYKHKKPVAINDNEPSEQSVWAESFPELILRNVFSMCTEMEGCMPFLMRMSHVCRLWRRVAIEPSLWHNIDLAGKWISTNPIVNDHNFRWLCENRLSKVQDLNLGAWKFAAIPNILDKIARSCVDLRGIGIMGWERLSADSLRYFIANCPRLERIDLSGISANQCCSNKSAVATSSLLYLIEEMGERLTHLVLSDNRLGGIPQLITSLSTYCPNLELLDLSNVRTVATTGQLHVEKLQQGCQKLRVLRITNSQLCVQTVPLTEQMSSEGFPMLEELSVACVSNSLTSVTQPFVDDNSIERILKTSNKLKLLDARGCARVTDSSLVRIPAWDLTHLFLSGSYVTRVNDSGLELIAQKWSHSLVEVDFAWATATNSVDGAVRALSEQENSPLRVLDLTGSSVSYEPVQAVLQKCQRLNSLNLSSCRALPRGMKRLYAGHELGELKITTNPCPLPPPNPVDDNTSACSNENDATTT